ncbi:rhodanese-like domain-containing protein [Nocardiopsis potens]|uniref:rhodanese-like domain-containing protein n=1 Tax=Nocardiopsis potens TaxID=1246458 RepID=UPI000346A752|nr:rhodanese-like domain-containing protein [Nocardiopsis potens]
MSHTSVDVHAVRTLTETDPDTLLVDVRTPAEYESARIPGAVNLPLQAVDAHLERIASRTGGRLVIVCQSGARALRFQERLAGAGAADTAVLTGGMNAWRAAGGPVVEGRRTWALERQVRLVAGGIVLASVLASVWWPPAVWVAGFIGAGLTFAAITDTCAMGMALAKLPYNRPRGVLDIEGSLARVAPRA